MRGALDIHRELLAADVPHEVVRLRGTVVGADDLPGVLGLDPQECVTVRCYVTEVGFVAAAVPAGTLPEPAALLAAVDARTLRVATADEINLATDYAAGLVSPFGLPSSTVLLADAALLGQDVVYCPVGEGGVALGIPVAHLLTVTGARVVPLTPLRLPRQPEVRQGVDLSGPDVDLRDRRPPGRPAGDRRR